MSLRKKTLSGILWTVLDTLVLRGFSFISTIILARWLGPSEFGLIGMIAVFVAIGASIADSGMAASIIRLKEANTEDYSTVFILNIILSLIFYLTIFISSPYISDFYNQPILTNLLRVYGVSFIISGFSAVQLAILNSRMEFKRIMKQNMAGTIFGVIVGLTLGYNGYGVWSIVMMYLSTQLVQSLVMWIRSDWKPSLYFSKEKAKFHFNFGYKLMLSGVLNTVFQNIYNILIGRFYSVKDLGYFERSKSLNDYPVVMLTSVMTKVTYPLLAGIRDDKKKIGVVYRKIIRFSFFSTCFIMFTASVIAKPLFDLILGKEWLPGVPYFQILCLSSIFYPIHAFNLNVFKVFGRSELFLKLEVIKKLIVVVCLFIGYKYGILGLVWSSVIANFLALFVNTYYSSDMVNYSGKQQFKDMFPTIIIAGIMFVSVNAILNNLPSFTNLVSIILGSVMCFIIYFILNFVIKADPLIYGLKLLKGKEMNLKNI